MKSSIHLPAANILESHIRRSPSTRNFARHTILSCKLAKNCGVCGFVDAENILEEHFMLSLNHQIL